MRGVADFIAGFGVIEVASEEATIACRQDVADSEAGFGQTEVADFGPTDIADMGCSVLAAFQQSLRRCENKALRDLKDSWQRL